MLTAYVGVQYGITKWCAVFACFHEIHAVYRSKSTSKLSTTQTRLRYDLRIAPIRYRGVAISVEDRDQKYSFVDVRDVAVLDPGVACHAGCLLRGGVDAFQQPGWEFSVEVRRLVLKVPKR